MIRIKDYKQPTTGVPIEWWELRQISVGMVEWVKLPDGRTLAVPPESPADQRNFPKGTVWECKPTAILNYGGYFTKPEKGDSGIMPVSVVQHQLPDDASAQLEKEFTAEGKEASIYYEADKLAVMHVEMFKGGEVLE